jgi:hypothetical protein
MQSLGILQNPGINHHSWELARFQPDFILVMFLMLMHDRFLGQIGARQFHPRISVSQIVQSLMIIMSDTQALPFFSRGHLLQMLSCHGVTLHLVPALCGRTRHYRIMMHRILGRMVSRIASNPVIVECFERCASALLAYPTCVPRIPLCVEISDTDVIFKLKTIWQMLSLCTILPEGKAILEISRNSLCDFQMRTYKKLYMMILFRDMFKTRNEVFLLFCEYYHSVSKLRKQRESDECSLTLKKSVEAQLQLQMGSHDFDVYCNFLDNFSSIFPEILKKTDNLFDSSLFILENFFQEMRATQITKPFQIYLEANTVSTFFGYSVLLQQENKKEVLEMLLNDQTPSERKTLHFCASPPVYYSPASFWFLFQLLQNANCLILPPELMECLDMIIYEARQYPFGEIKNQFLYLMVLVFGFAKWSQSDHFHLRQFILDCVSYMKSTRTTEHGDLARFLHLQKFQSRRLRDPFYDLFKIYQKFAHPSMGCSEPTEQTLLCFFNQMHMVFSNQQFLRIIQEFLKTFEDKNNVRSESSICHDFLEKLVNTPEFHSMIQGIGYFRRNTCHARYGLL